MVEAYNTDPKVHGILVQLPLPKHIDERRILDAISIDKDIDGFHPANIGCVGMRGREPIFVPCTPKVRTQELLCRTTHQSGDMYFVSPALPASSHLTSLASPNTGLHRAASSLQNPHRGQAGRRHRPLQHRGPAGIPAPPEPRRHRHSPALANTQRYGHLRR